MDAAHLLACPHCFGDLSATPCPHCGWRIGVDNPPPALPLGTLLDRRYRIGRVLGHGGFGITYLAWEENLQQRLAIKEYLPRDCATRAPDGVSLAIYSGQAGEQFAYGLDRFLEEARALARFDQHPGIVTVKSFFRAHGTGYCMMDYVEGLTLKQYLERQPGGRIPVEQAWRLLAPVMDALRAVHKEGLLHRDLAPDNIYIARSGRVKLIDFGAARFAAGEHSRSLSIILKPGYAPEEQYRTRGQQGSWTDVYGLAATLYRAITGSAPPEALDRLDHDDLAAPSVLGIDITSDHEEVLLKALAVKAGDRYPSIADWQEDWAHRTPNHASPISEPLPFSSESNEVDQASVERKKARSGLIFAVVGIAGILAVVGTLWWKEQTDRPLLLPEADFETAQTVGLPEEKPEEAEPEIPISQTPVVSAPSTATQEIVEQPSIEALLEPLSDPAPTASLPANMVPGCSDSQSIVDRTICENPVLKALQTDLLHAYQEVRRLSTREEVVMLERAHARWIAQREAECSEESPSELISCLRIKTNSRLDLLLGRHAFGSGSEHRLIPTFVVQDGQGPMYELDIQYLRFAAPDKPGERALNATTQTYLDETSYIAEDYEGGSVWEIRASQQLSYASENMISIKTKRWAYLGGAHEVWSSEDLHIDLSRGNILTFRDFFPPSALGILVNDCRDQLIIQKRESFNDSNYDPASDSNFDDKRIVDQVGSLENWSFLPAEAVVTFGLYSIGAFAEGEFECRFGQSDLTALALSGSLLPYGPTDNAIGATPRNVGQRRDSTETAQVNPESPRPVAEHMNEISRASSSTEAKGKIPIYYANEAPPESYVPPEAPLCYRFMVSGLEEQLSKLKAKYHDLYGDEITADGYGGKALIAKRRDATGKEIKYFYSTSPQACSDYQNRNMAARNAPASEGKWRFTKNEHGAILESGTERLYLGKDCDAYSPSYGKGTWSWSNAGFGVDFPTKNFGFPKQDSPLSQINCRLK